MLHHKMFVSHTQNLSFHGFIVHHVAILLHIARHFKPHCFDCNKAVTNNLGLKLTLHVFAATLSLCFQMKPQHVINFFSSKFSQESICTSSSLSPSSPEVAELVSKCGLKWLMGHSECFLHSSGSQAQRLLGF